MWHLCKLTSTPVWYCDIFIVILKRNILLLNQSVKNVINCHKKQTYLLPNGSPKQISEISLKKYQYSSHLPTPVQLYSIFTISIKHNFISINLRNWGYGKLNYSSITIKATYAFYDIGTATRNFRTYFRYVTCLFPELKSFQQ